MKWTPSKQTLAWNPKFSSNIYCKMNLSRTPKIKPFRYTKPMLDYEMFAAFSMEAIGVFG